MASDGDLAPLARNSHGAFTTAQATALGFTRNQISRRCSSGAWVRWCHGVMTIAASPHTFEQRCAIAVLATRGAAVSHEAAARIRRVEMLDPSRRNVVSISTPPGSHSPFDWVRTYHSTQLDPCWIEQVRGLPVLTLERTMVDLAWVFDAPRMGAVLDAALDRRTLDLDRLITAHRQLACRGRNGAGLIRPLLYERGVGTHTTRSRLEAMFIDFVAEYDLPRPSEQMRFWSNDVAVGIVDFYWPELRVVIETDGRLGHLQRMGFENDRVRDQEVGGAGCVPQRVTWRQLTKDRDACAERLRRMFEQQRRLHLPKSCVNGGENQHSV